LELSYALVVSALTVNVASEGLDETTLVVGVCIRRISFDGFIRLGKGLNA